MGAGRGVKLRLVCLVSMHDAWEGALRPRRERGWRPGAAAAGNTLAGGKELLWEGLVPCRKPEERERRSGLWWLQHRHMVSVAQSCRCVHMVLRTHSMHTFHAHI